jgi:hypothetical protein
MCILCRTQGNCIAPPVVPPYRLTNRHSVCPKPYPLPSERSRFPTDWKKEIRADASAYSGNCRWGDRSNEHQYFIKSASLDVNEFGDLEIDCRIVSNPFHAPRVEGSYGGPYDSASRPLNSASANS